MSECQWNWCHPLRISFTEYGKKATDWVRGYSWGLRFYVDRYDWGFTFTIRQTIQSLPQVAVGPNSVLPNSQLKPKTPSAQLATPPPTTPGTRPNNTAVTILPPPNTESRLLGLIEGAFLVLNRTNPNMTQSCWLCFASSPPYYEGIGQDRKINATPDHTRCPWGNTQKLTLAAVSGRGLCIGQVPSDKTHLCNQTNTTQFEEGQYLVPPLDTAWACDTGLTPCVHTSVFNQSKNYCVLVQLIPRLLYHDDGSFIDEFDHKTRWKREPVTLTLAVLLGLGVAAGVGTGGAALVQGPQYYNELRAAMDTDLGTIEQSITKLEESLTSLSEVVLQNRRGLDLLFLKEGGLCAALKEECCFYADHSGVIKDSMSKLRERLDRRRRERESGQGWFESWFNRSPWLTTLVSTLAGPLIILMLLLTFGPCILNKLVAFIKERISAVQVMVLRQHYQALPRSDAEDPL